MQKKRTQGLTCLDDLLRFFAFKSCLSHTESAEWILGHGSVFFPDGWPFDESSFPFLPTLASPVHFFLNILFDVDHFK